MTVTAGMVIGVLSVVILEACVIFYAIRRMGRVRQKPDVDWRTYGDEWNRRH